MGKMQNVSFSSVQEFLDYLPEDEKRVVNFLRDITLDCMPFCIEKLSYNVPYYYLNSRVCFIWPSSIPWGKVKLNGVQFGFCNGYLLNDEIGFLEKGDRKQVYTKTYTNIKDVEIDLLKTFIFEAIEVDKQLKRK